MLGTSLRAATGLAYLLLQHVTGTIFEYVKTDSKDEGSQLSSIEVETIWPSLEKNLALMTCRIVDC
ncbi:hypothetical protein RND71_021859 [Anisodus tanguticus]|uniref:Uncharacterized protein n=1 Tax=Anisodus tanguticus TaxID=243964 RepID=A0AAE1RXB5_9SOLA|nr:hypothetical protein RND71_021859 [Anisodus tanguticus]